METAIIPSQDPDKRILTFRKPNGVYAGITPWNFPTLIPVELIAPGIAAGNTIVMKPSEWTPIAMANFMQIMADAGLPDGVVNVVYGGGKVGEQLITDENIDCVAFIGSHTTAEKIVRAAGLKRSLIEASGNGPVIVCADADLESAAKGAVFGGFFCAGQVCCATERVLVDKRVHDDFLAAVVREAETWKLGDPYDDDTLVGPMNNEPTAQKMDAHLEDAVGKGAEIVVGGSRDGDRPTNLYYQPTVIDQVGTDTLINREETFGPIVPLIRVDGDDEALAVANDSHLGLQAAVYTSSLKRAFRFLDNLQVGNVVVNDSTDYWEAHEPFGGASGTRTGWGRIGGRYTMLDMTDLKTVVMIDTAASTEVPGAPCVGGARRCRLRDARAGAPGDRAAHRHRARSRGPARRQLRPRPARRLPDCRDSSGSGAAHRGCCASRSSCCSLATRRSSPATASRRGFRPGPCRVSERPGSGSASASRSSSSGPTRPTSGCPGRWLRTRRGRSWVPRWARCTESAGRSCSTRC